MSPSDAETLVRSNSGSRSSGEDDSLIGRSITAGGSASQARHHRASGRRSRTGRARGSDRSRRSGSSRRSRRRSRSLSRGTRDPPSDRERGRSARPRRATMAPSRTPRTSTVAIPADTIVTPSVPPSSLTDLAGSVVGGESIAAVRADMLAQERRQLDALAASAATAKLDPLPALSDAKTWPAFKKAVDYYLLHDGYSNPSGGFAETDSNRGQSRRWSTLLSKPDLLVGDARALFVGKETEVEGLGFAKLAMLHGHFIDTSELATGLTLLDFFKDCSQNDDTPLEYQARLIREFQNFESAKLPINGRLQLLFQLRGLNPKYSNFVQQLRNKSIKFEEQNLGAVTDWCNWFDKEGWKSLDGAETGGRRRTTPKKGGPAASAVADAGKGPAAADPKGTVPPDASTKEGRHALFKMMTNVPLSALDGKLQNPNFCFCCHRFVSKDSKKGRETCPGPTECELAKRNGFCITVLPQNPAAPKKATRRKAAATPSQALEDKNDDQVEERTGAASAQQTVGSATSYATENRYRELEFSDDDNGDEEK